MKDRRQQLPDSRGDGDEKSTVMATGRAMTGWNGKWRRWSLVREGKEGRVRRRAREKKGGEETGGTLRGIRRRR